jgi:competence protein ComFC
MIHIWQNLLDSIAPPTEAGTIVRTYSPENFRRHYQPQLVGNVTALATYHTPAVHAAVASCKFERNRHAATLLAHLLLQHLSTLEHTPTIAIAVPLSRERARTRGYNQVERVLHALPKTTDSFKVVSNVLTRTRHTTPQTDLGRAERLTNVAGAFTLTRRAGAKIPADCTRIIICDDVVTTGATIEAAVLALRAELPTHIEIIAIAWAH